MEKIKEYEELLNACINHIINGENLTEGIKILLEIGFTKTQLCSNFNFNENDVNYALSEIEDENETEDD